MARSVSYKINKFDRIDLIIANIKDIPKVQASMASLDPWERNTLAILKRMGASFKIAP